MANDESSSTHWKRNEQIEAGAPEPGIDSAPNRESTPTRSPESRWENAPTGPTRETQATSRRISREDVFYNPGRTSPGKNPQEFRRTPAPPVNTGAPVVPNPTIPLTPADRHETTVQLAVFQPQEIAELLSVLRQAATGDFAARANLPQLGVLQTPGTVTDVFALLNQVLEKAQATEEQAALAMVASAVVSRSESEAASAVASDLALPSDWSQALGRCATSLGRAERFGSDVIEQARAQTTTFNELTQRAQILQERAASAVAALEETLHGTISTAPTVEPTPAAAHTQSSNENGNRALDQMVTRADVLALNAAIESARAGEAGRGFGVLATAMRRLHDDLQLLSEMIEDVAPPTVTAPVQAMGSTADAAMMAALLQRLRRQLDEASSLITSLQSSALSQQRLRKDTEETLFHLTAGREALNLLIARASAQEVGNSVAASTKDAPGSL